MSSKVHTDNAPAAIGPYSQAVVAGKLVFTSGQIPLNPETGLLEGSDITQQAHRVCKNLQAVLEAAGASLKSAVKTVCFLSDMADFAAFNEVYAQYFTEKPARSCVAVKTLPKGALVEVEVIAEVEKNT
ncbi:MAG: RidA family protein [Oscillospiraceae bacterium]|nr:RidA family protein [Oscillospiraceae bacterium]